MGGHTAAHLIDRVPRVRTRTAADLSFRPAVAEDARVAQAAYREITAHLGRTGDHARWHSENHPAPEEVRAWAESGTLHLALAAEETAGAGEQIAGVVVLDHESPQGYQEASWANDAAPGEVLIVHALGVLPGFQRRGIARFLVDSALRTARERGCRAVRLDAYVENTPARELYIRCGFTDLGEHSIHYEGTDLTRFHLFEYVL